jgi:hypothetical protein
MKFTKIVLSAFVLLAIVAVGMAAFMQPSTNETEAPIRVVPQPRHDTSTWQAYSDDRIAFRYPADWEVRKIQRQDPSNLTTNLTLVDTKRTYATEDSPLYPISISYQMTTGRDNRNAAIEALVKKESIVIGGKFGRIIQGTTPPVLHDIREVESGQWSYSFTNFGGTIARGVTDEQYLANVFETVLSTVEFPNN